jgi:cellulose biosynthesis protein BcsQ
VENQNSAVAVSLVSTKGGEGKTTLTANIAAPCADLGLRVLVIDCDKKASMSKLFKIANLAARQIDADCISRSDIDNLDLILRDAGVPAALEALKLGFQAIEQALAQFEKQIYTIWCSSTRLAQRGFCWIWASCWRI